MESDTFSSEDYSTVDSMIANTGKRTSADLLRRTYNSIFLLKCLHYEGFLKDYPPSEVQQMGGCLLGLLQKFSCNAYNISCLSISNHDVKTSEYQEIGGAIYPTIARTNHACCNNTLRVSVGKKCALFAIHSIPKGGEILDNYGQGFTENPVDVRNEVLVKQYLFLCTCDACSNKWPTYNELHQTPSQFKSNIKKSGKQLENIMTEVEKTKSLLIKHETDKALTQLCLLMGKLRDLVEVPSKHVFDLELVLAQALRMKGNIYYKN